MNDKVGLFWGDCHYPGREVFFDENNNIYKLVKTGLFQMGLDAEHYYTDDWNPMSDIITQGDTVLIKPNMVLNKNRGKGGVECLYTHPSVVVPIVEYVVKALQGSGKIIIGDAPIQNCDFDELTIESGYRSIVEHYCERGIDISLIDFRNVKTIRKGEVNYLKEKKDSGGILVSVDEESAFTNMDDSLFEKFRVTNYAPSVMHSHHKGKKHEYMISDYLLEADVVINVPKPKTHRKAGITAALKNMVGINTNKEYLPHHRVGGTNSDGDEYPGDSFWHDLASKALDITEELVGRQEYLMAEKTRALYDEFFSRAYRESDNGYSEGSWYGNDTIWRTIQDLNTILFYADKNGRILDTKQRKNFIIADMIVSGDKEGPLEPDPVPLGLIAMGYNPIILDKCIAQVMGFDWERIPTLKNIKLKGFSVEFQKERIITNDEKNKGCRFEPSCGWIYALGSPGNEEVIKKAKQEKEVYLFGACPNGRRNADMLINSGVNIIAFLDNDDKKVKEWRYRGIETLNPDSANRDKIIVVSTAEKHTDAIKTQLLELGFKNVMVMR